MTTQSQALKITIEDIITLESIGVHFHAYRLPSSSHRLKAYFSCLQDTTLAKINSSSLSNSTKELLIPYLVKGLQVVPLL